MRRFYVILEEYLFIIESEINEEFHLIMKEYLFILDL